MASITRSVSLQLRPGVKVDDLPHQLRIPGDLALVVVPGRAPPWLRCKDKGQIRRECRVARCALGRRFGHDESQCVRTYANVTGPMENDGNSKYLMDAANARWPHRALRTGRPKGKRHAAIRSRREARQGRRGIGLRTLRGTLNSLMFH